MTENVIKSAVRKNQNVVNAVFELVKVSVQVNLGKNNVTDINTSHWRAPQVGGQAVEAAGAPPSQEENPPLSNQPPAPVGEQTSTGTSKPSRRANSSNKPLSVPTDPDDFRNISVGAKEDENLPTSSSPFVTNDEFQ